MQPLRPYDPVRLGKYQLVARLGVGATGRVFLGHGPSGDLVAVKVVHARLAQRQDRRERFAREVAAVCDIDPAYAAPVVDHDMDAEEPWLASVYLPGLNLRQAVETHGPLSGPSVRALAEALAEALRAIHRAGVLHRDLTPPNVVLTSDGPRVVDFGIARPDGADTITAPGSLLGTPGYLPPERIRDRVSERAGDVFAFGALLVYAATGEGPFGSGSTQVLLYRTQSEEPRLEALRAALDGDRELIEMIVSCLARDPGRRPTAEELVEAATGEREATTPAPRPPEEVAKSRADAGEAMPAGCGAHTATLARRTALTLTLSSAFVLSLKPSALRGPQGAARRPPRTDGRSPIWTYRSPDADDGHWFIRPTVAGDVVHLGSTGGIHAVGCSQGNLLWTAIEGKPVRSGTVVVAETVLFSDGELRAVKAADGSPVLGWRKPGVGVTGVPVVIGEEVFLCDARGDLTAYDGRSGRRCWRLPLAPSGSFEGNLDPVSGGDLVYVAPGGLFAVETTFRAVRWRFGDADTAPVVWGGLVYSAGARHVHALDAVTGAVRWSRDLGGRVTGGVTVADGLVFAGDGRGRLHALDAGTGRPRWRFETNGPLCTASPVTAGTIYAAAEHDRLYAIGTLDGRLRWSHPLGRQTNVHAQLWHDRVLVCVDRTQLCAFPL